MPRIVSKMYTSADPARNHSEGVFIPRGVTGLGLFVPTLDAASDLDVEIGYGIYETYYHTRGIPLTDFIVRKPSDLVAYYCFTGTATDVVKDLTEDDHYIGGITSARSHSLTINGNPTVDAGTNGLSERFGSGIKLDGTGDYLSLAHADGNKFDITTSDFSIRMACKIPATTSKMVLASKEYGVGGTGVGWEVGISATNDYPYLTVTDSSGSTTITGNAAVDTTYAQILDWTFDRNGNGTCYANGAANGSAGAISARALTLTNAGSFIIGADGTSTPANAAIATIYDFALFNKVRTTGEILRDAAGGYGLVKNPAGGATLVISASSGGTPCYVDLSAYAGAASGKTIRVKTATQQTATNDLEFVFNYWF
jgi:hypothetical protein